MAEKLFEGVVILGVGLATPGHILSHKYPVITTTTSTGCGYRPVWAGFVFLQRVLPEGFVQTRSRSKSVAIAPS
jgi:hypothetical protein